MNPRVFCFDLELNQPSKSIIQIGGVIGNIYTGEVHDRVSYYIRTPEIIDPYITTLTGITQSDTDSGYSLDLAWNEIQLLLEKHKISFSPITWGAGDLYLLKSQVKRENSVPWHRAYDLKTVYQALQIANRKSPKAGLAKAMGVYGIPFEGKQHDALADAENTFKLAVKVTSLIKSVSIQA